MRIEKLSFCRHLAVNAKLYFNDVQWRQSEGVWCRAGRQWGGFSKMASPKTLPKDAQVGEKTLFMGNIFIEYCTYWCVNSCEYFGSYAICEIFGKDGFLVWYTSS